MDVQGPLLIRDESHGVSIENQSFVVLSVGVVGQDETREIPSGEWDQSVDAAVSTVANELEKLAKRKNPRPRL